MFNEGVSSVSIPLLCYDASVHDCLQIEIPMQSTSKKLQRMFKLLQYLTHFS